MWIDGVIDLFNIFTIISLDRNTSSIEKSQYFHQYSKMPNKNPTLPNSIDKSRQRIHQALRRGESCLKFVKFEEKQIIYKLNKYNYV